ncbi:MAG: hypothetical protein IJQ25_03795 [Oscillibacter sp.]|nr:hypothetical protein [Oscillibacter sp.]MBQ7682764.1 hypothetical protein [Oscillibacter sp.]
MQLYYAVTAADFVEAVGHGRRFVHVAYRVGEQSELLRRAPPLQTHGDFMSVSDRDAGTVEHPEALCGAVARECARRGYRGAVLDFEAEPRDDLRAFAALLEPRLRESRRALYVPGTYIDAAPDAVELVCTAVSGGNFQEYLSEILHRRGGGKRVALDVQRLRMDFRLPAPTGEGVPLEADAFEALRAGKAVYFSPDLCARYFTCTRGGQAHFVLFDDADTIRHKLRIGAACGVETAFLQWPEVRDIADTLNP